MNMLENMHLLRHSPFMTDVGALMNIMAKAARYSGLATRKKDETMYIHAHTICCSGEAQSRMCSFLFRHF